MAQQLPTVEIDLSPCKGGGLCIDNCPPDVLALSAQFNGLGYRR